MGIIKLVLDRWRCVFLGFNGLAGYIAWDRGNLGELVGCDEMMIAVTYPPLSLRLIYRMMFHCP